MPLASANAEPGARAGARDASSTSSSIECWRASTMAPAVRNRSASDAARAPSWPTGTSRSDRSKRTTPAPSVPSAGPSSEATSMAGTPASIDAASVAGRE